MPSVRKLFHRHRRSQSDSTNDVSSISEEDVESMNSTEPRKNPYALETNPYNSAAFTYNFHGDARNPDTFLRPDQTANFIEPTESSPYDTMVPGNRKSAPPHVFRSDADDYVSNSNSHPTSPAVPDTNPYSLYAEEPPMQTHADDEHTLELARQQLLQKYRKQPDSPQSQQLQLQQQQMINSSEYDPSIMETEQEREARLQSSTQDIHEHAYEQEYQHQQDLEQEELEVQQLKKNIRATNKETISSANNVLNYAQQAEDSGLRTLQMLGEQSDQLANSEKAIALTENQTRLAEDYAAELKSLNRSMFAVHVSNPFNSRRRIAEQELKIRDTFQDQQAQRDQLRRQHYASQQQISSAMGNLPGERRRQMTELELKYYQQMQDNKRKLAEESKYMFEPEAEDHADEQEIQDRLTQIGAASARLNLMAKAINNEVEDQTARAKRLGDKTSDLEVGVHLNSSRLARIV
ncbi:uncharacterized protein V1516DRAFT_676008 [Lipomyces oligophaga]|uniref:uncharacterized protein n=1 Tax=Lipomyces oligophaga TaxID=45792 RepID=UPI0034CECB68